MRVLVAVEAVDFRKGIDSLAQLCRDKLASDPFSGCVFVFRSRRATSIKVSVYDGMGFWLATKRLSQGRFRWWPEGETAREVPGDQLLFAAGNPDLAAALLGARFTSVDALLPALHRTAPNCGQPTVRGSLR